MKITLMRPSCQPGGGGRAGRPPPLALALMKVKQATAAEAEAFAAAEASWWRSSQPRTDETSAYPGAVTFRAPEAGEYEEHRQLAETPAEIRLRSCGHFGADTIS